MGRTTWAVHVRIAPPVRAEDAALASSLARAAGAPLDEELLEAEPLRVRVAYLRKYEAERLFRSLRQALPHAVAWMEPEEPLEPA